MHFLKTERAFSMKFEALPRPQAGDVVWEIEQEGEILEIQVEEENFKQKQHYIVYPLQQVQDKNNVQPYF